MDDLLNMPEWLPSMIEIKDVTGEGVGKRGRWAYKMVGMRFEGETTCTEHAPNERTVFQTTGGIPSTWTWTYTPEDEQTRIDLTVEYTVPVPVLGRLAEALVVRQNERELELAMTNIQGMVEG